MNAAVEPTLSRRLILTIVGLVCLSWIITILIALNIIQSARESAIGSAEDQVLRFSTGAQTSLNRSLLAVDVMLASVDDVLQSSRLGSDRMDSNQVSHALRAGVEHTMLTRNVAVLTKDGKVVASSERDGPQKELALPSNFLQRVVRAPLYTVSVSDPVPAGDDGERLIYLARTVKLLDQSEWVTVAEVPVGLLAAILVQGTGASELEVTLERADGQLLVSAPLTTKLSTERAPPLEDLVASGAVEQGQSRLSAVPALLTVRRTLYRGVWITTALPLARALAQWRSDRKTVLGAASVVLVLTLLGGAFVFWYLSRLGRATQTLADSKLVLDQALNSMASGFFLLDSQHRLVKWNGHYEEIIPGVRGRLAPLMPFREVFELVCLEIMPDADQAARSAWVEARAQLLLGTQGTKEMLYPSGQVVQVFLRRTPDGGTVCVINDVTEEKRAQASLRIAATAFESQEGILVTDANRRILRVNQAFIEATGYEAQDVLGRNPRIFSSGHQDRAFHRAMSQSIIETGHWQGEIMIRRKNAQMFPAHLTITAVKDEAGAVTHFVATLLDISLRKAAAEEIERLAFYDPLTSLPNRRLLMDRLQQALVSSARSGRKGALLFLDLDHFKVLNDTLGHDFGDVLLRQVAQRLAAAVREGDTVARLGGDEFVVLLEDLSEHAIDAAEQSKIVGEKVLASLNQAHDIASHHHHSSCSIGAVLFTGQQQSIDELLKQADLAMYDAKAAGRNALRFFDPQMQASISKRAALEKDLRQALTYGQFVLHYQTQVTHAGHSVGAEVLIRWRHPERGLVSPFDFIPLAEETGLILPIGLWVLQTACAQLKAWELVPTCRDLQLAVNVSARQFRQTDFVAQVAAVLQQTGARAHLLKIELTESVVLDNVADTIAKMNAIKSVGVRFSMDDFGTGQSSLSYLTRLPLDQIKIDQSFVRNIGIKPADALIVQTIIGMAHNLGLEVIAEGVETQAQRAFLEQNGCTLCQGYLLGRPVPLADFESGVR